MDMGGGNGVKMHHNLETAIDKLKAAIKLHQAHMDGTEPTDNVSQEKLMALMKDSLNAIMEHMQEMEMSKLAKYLR